MSDIWADVRCFQAPPDIRVGETTLRGYSASPPDPKHRTPPYSPLRGLTFVERAMFLTGSSKAFRLRCSTMLPNPIVRLLQLETKTVSLLYPPFYLKLRKLSNLRLIASKSVFKSRVLMYMLYPSLWAITLSTKSSFCVLAYSSIPSTLCLCSQSYSFT